YPWQQSLFWGFLIAASSTAIVLKLLFERQELDSPQGRVILGVLLFQDLFVVPMMAIIPTLTAPPAALAPAILFALAEALAVLALVVLVARYVFPLLWRRIVLVRNKEVFLIATIFFSLGTAWACSTLGLSLALGAFLAGLVLSESEYAHQILSEILPFRDSFSSLFFISIGMLLDLGFARTEWMLVAALAAGIFAVKLLTGMTSVVAMGFPLRTSLLVGLGLAQVGEFSFVLLREGAGLNLITENDFQTFLAAAVITMMLTPLVIQLSPALAARLPELRRLRRFFPEPGETELAQQAKPLHDHVIVCGYGLNGRLAAEVLARAGIQYLVLEMNPETVRRGAAEGQPIFFGDGSNDGILEKAGARRARALVYAISDPFVLGRAVANARAFNPGLAIIARTKRLEDVPTLKRAGASHVVAEEMRAAEEIIICLLSLFGVPRREAFEQIHKVRAHHDSAQVE
ncbi:MAG: cation:proton antiporter, partial [Terriglobia bacterium]